MVTVKNTGKKSFLMKKGIFVFSMILTLAAPSSLSADRNSVNPLITSIKSFDHLLR